MTSRAVTDPTSYRFQANIHGTEDTATNSQEMQSWDQCEHGSFYFFAWHRMYPYFFHRILRAAAQDPNLVLPYWNWGNSAQRSLPLPFRQPADASNPLYIPHPGGLRVLTTDLSVFPQAPSMIPEPCPTSISRREVHRALASAEAPPRRRSSTALTVTWKCSLIMWCIRRLAA